MGLPFEALIPYAIMIGMFGVTGVGLAATRLYTNNGKRPRWNVDLWDRQMMHRDQRMTGIFRGQSDTPEAPQGFELNSQWKTETRII